MSGIESISREDLGWLSGFIDGEGCFYLGFNVQQDREIPRKTMRTTIITGSTTIEPLEKMSDILYRLGIGFSCILKKESGNPKWNRSIAIVVSGHGRTERLARIVLSQLTCKKEVARQLIHACAYRRYLAEKNGGNNKNSSLIHDPILTAMAKRMKELNSFRSDITKYSRIASTPIRPQKPSTTARLAAIEWESCTV